MSPKLSLIIPTFREGGFDCLLGSLKNQTLSPNEWELIVVDELYEWRKDEVAEYVKELEVPLVHVPAKKPEGKPMALATNWNEGVRWAEGNYVMFGQDFIWLSPDCFERHLKLQKPYGRVTTGYMHHAYAPRLGDLRGKLTVFDKMYEERPEKIQLPDIRFKSVAPVSENCDLGPFKDRENFMAFQFHLFCSSYSVFPNVTVPLSACLALNGFDERFDIGHGYQDDDFCFRLALAGFEFILDRKNVMYHYAHPWSDSKARHPDASNIYYTLGNSLVEGFSGIKAPNPFDLVQERCRIRYERWVKEEGEVEKPPLLATYIQEPQQRRVQWIADECRGNSSILEVGCSEGYVLRKVGGNAGIDINAEVIEQNKRQYPNIRWVHGDAIQGLPFEDNEYDVVLLTEILEHIPYDKVNQLIMQALRVASKKVLITIPNATYPQYNRRYVESPHHRWACTLGKLYVLSIGFITVPFYLPNYGVSISWRLDNDFIYITLCKLPKTISQDDILMESARKLHEEKRKEAQKLGGDVKVFSEDLDWGHEEDLIKGLMGGRGGLFIDVGAGIGSYCVNLSPHFNEVWAFEPFRENREKLLKNIDLFQTKNIKVFPYAIGNRKEIRNLYQSTNSPLTVGFVKSYLTLKNGFLAKQTYQPTMRQNFIGPTKDLGAVEVTTLNDVVGEREVDLIKVDVEGFEKEVVLGASRIMNQVKRWQIETHTIRDFSFLLRKFSELGYETTTHTCGGSRYIIAERGNRKNKEIGFIGG